MSVVFWFPSLESSFVLDVDLVMLTLEIVEPEVIPRWWSRNSNLWNLATSGAKGVGFFAWASRDGAEKKFLFQHPELMTPQT